MVGWLIVCLGFNLVGWLFWVYQPFETVFQSISGRLPKGGGRVVRRCWVINFQCRGVLRIWIIVGQGPIALVVGAVGGCLDIFSLIYHCSLLSPSLWERARYRLKYCLKGPLSLKPSPKEREKEERKDR